MPFAAQTQNVVFLPHNQIKSFIKTTHPDIISIGCGLSQDGNAISLFKQVLNIMPADLPLIIDADGLNILANYPEFFCSKKF